MHLISDLHAHLDEALASVVLHPGDTIHVAVDLGLRGADTWGPAATTVRVSTVVDRDETGHQDAAHLTLDTDDAARTWAVVTDATNTWLADRGLPELEPVRDWLAASDAVSVLDWEDATYAATMDAAAGF